MSKYAFDSAYVALSGRLFVIGGWNTRTSVQNSVECFDPMTDEWQTVAPMHHARRNPVAQVSNGFIYVLGGEYKGVPYQSIEKYNPRENTWSEVISVLL